MNTPDIINACFEFGAVLALLLNCRRLYRDKKVNGVSVIPFCFYTAWGFWNIYYYPAVGSVLSGCVAAAVAAVNLTWVAMALYYARCTKKEAA